MELVESKQPPYSLIYSLGLTELETVKDYIENHLKTGFIWPSKSPTSMPIFFDKKLNRVQWLCIDYQDLNNLIIKNHDLLPLMGKSIDRLGGAKGFT